MRQIEAAQVRGYHVLEDGLVQQQLFEVAAIAVVNSRNHVQQCTNTDNVLQLPSSVHMNTDQARMHMPTQCHDPASQRLQLNRHILN